MWFFYGKTFNGIVMFECFVYLRFLHVRFTISNFQWSVKEIRFFNKMQCYRLETWWERWGWQKSYTPSPIYPLPTRTTTVKAFFDEGKNWTFQHVYPQQLNFPLKITCTYIHMYMHVHTNTYKHVQTLRTNENCFHFTPGSFSWREKTRKRILTPRIII